MKTKNINRLAGWLLLTSGMSGQTPNAQAVSPPRGPSIEALDHMTSLPGGLTALPSPPIPAANPQSQAKIDLGRALFHDMRLSSDNSLSCASCHDSAKAYSDGKAIAVGRNRTVLKRRTPSLLNIAYNSAQFWDGRATSLEDQVLIPLQNKNEMGMADQKTLLARLNRDRQYPGQFREAFGGEINLIGVQQAISAFERSLVTPDSAFDRYANGDKGALSDQEKRGLLLFIGQAGCSQCHNGPNFTDNKFHNLGLLPGERADADGGLDPGHFAISKHPADRHTFKTPSLRSSAQQSYFMHNGSVATLEQVVSFYDVGGGKGPKSRLLVRLDLTESGKQDLVAFLNALAGHVPGGAEKN